MQTETGGKVKRDLQMEHTRIAGILVGRRTG